MAVLAALQDGVCRAHENGQRVRHLVLTDGSGDLDFAGFYAAFTKRLMPRLRRAGYVEKYAVALEVQPASARRRGHVLLVEPAGANGYIPKPALDKMTSECGFGWAWISEVKDIPAVGASLADYFTKGVAGATTVPSKAVGEIGSYMAKAQEMAQLAGLAGQRLRPFRVSCNWKPSLADAAHTLRDEMYGAASDDGPWHVVNERRCAQFLEPLRNRQRLEAERERRWRLAEERWALGNVK